MNTPAKGGSEEEYLPPRKRPYYKGQIGEHTPMGVPNQGSPVDLPHNNEHTGPPWNEELGLVELPTKFGISQLPRYNGKSYHREHIRSHTLHILLYSADARIYARTFPLGLEGEARSWFMCLEPGSIDSWETLSTKFLEEFEGRYEHQEKERTLQRVKQAPDESILEYYDRF